MVKPEMPQPTPIRPNGTKASLSRPTYDPSLLLILEYATSLALRDRITIEMLGKQVADALQSSLRENRNLHPEVVSRLGYCLFGLLHASNVSEYPQCSYSLKLTGIGLRLHTGAGATAHIFINEY